ncbi:MAG: hypothetical protein RR994_01380 [Clostridia bacterium]
MPSVNFKSGNTARYALVFVSCAAAAWAVFGLVFLALPILDIIKFFLFQIFAVVIPGIAIFKLVNLRLSLLEALTVSYGLGIGAISCNTIFAVCGGGTQRRFRGCAHSQARSGFFFPKRYRRAESRACFLHHSYVYDRVYLVCIDAQSIG